MHPIRFPAAILVPTAGLAALASAGANAQSRQVFFTDFDSPLGVPQAFSGVTTLGSVEGFAGIGPAGRKFAGNLLHNRTGYSLNPGPNMSGSPTRITLSG